MAKFTDNLSRVRIAAPCSADWEGMTGTERVRLCNSCDMRVYNLSAMTRAEAERLVTNAEGRLCVRFYRRADGTILTQNCPVGLRRLKQRAQRIATATLSAVIGFITGLGTFIHLSPQRTAIGEPVLSKELTPSASMPTTEAMLWETGEAPAVEPARDMAIAGQMIVGRFEVKPSVTKKRKSRRP